MQVFIPAPEADSAATFVAESVPGGVLASRAGEPFKFALSDEAAELTLVAYAETLETLDLSEGTVERATCRPCTLLDPLAVFTAHFDGGVARWTPVEAPGDALLDVLIPDRMRCAECTHFIPEIDTDPRFFPNTRAFVLPNDGTRALIVRHEGDAYWVNREGTLELACTPGDLIASAYSAAPNVIWVATSSGTLARWELDRLRADRPCSDAATARTASATPDLYRIDGAPDDMPIEIFANTVSQQMWRYSDAGWEKVGAVLDGDGNRAAAWLGPGRGLAACEGNDLLIYDGGEIEQGPLIIEGVMIKVSSAKHLASFGAVLGTRYHLVLFERPNHGFGFAASTAPTAERVDAFAEHRGSIFIAAGRGRMRELHPTLGYCDGQELFNGQSPQDLVVLDDGTIIAAPGEVMLAHPVSNVCPN